MKTELYDLDPHSRGKLKALERRRAQGRSAVSNGTVLLPEIDGRTKLARRFKDIVSQITADQGGEDRIAEARLQLIRRFGAVSVLCEEMEARMAQGEAISIEKHSLLVSSLVRVAQRIGINRRAKDVVPTLESYLRARTDDNEEIGG